MKSPTPKFAAVVLSGLLVLSAACGPGVYTRPDGTIIDAVVVHPAGSIQRGDGGFDLYLETEIDAPAEQVWAVVATPGASASRTRS